MNVEGPVMGGDEAVWMGLEQGLERKNACIPR
jgi:hypothetical protein